MSTRFERAALWPVFEWLHARGLLSCPGEPDRWSDTAVLAGVFVLPWAILLIAVALYLSR